jgi:3-hydroxyacyl-CoA dehydrogenase/enoyl-CoA hydratase/3-hydroxybutyryl-CoA epimerase
MAPAESIRHVVEAGRLGRKGGSGFYRYENGKKKGVDESVYQLIPRRATAAEMSARDIIERCVYPMLNEAARCLEEGIIRSPRDGDLGAVFGIGFPPFRGGPFRYMDTVGIPAVVQLLEAFNTRFAPRYAPARLLVELAHEHRRFYPVEGRPV